MVDPPNLLREETDFREIYTVETPRTEENEQEKMKEQNFKGSDDTVTENIITGTPSFIDNLNALYENRENFENTIFDENEMNPLDNTLAEQKQNQNVPDNISGMNRFAKEGRVKDISLKLDQKIRQALQDGEVSSPAHDSIIENVIQYADEENGIDVIEIVPPILLHDTGIMKGDSSSVIEDDISNTVDSQTVQRNNRNDNNVDAEDLKNQTFSTEKERHIISRNAQGNNASKLTIQDQQPSGNGHNLIDNRKMAANKESLHLSSISENHPNSEGKVSSDVPGNKKEQEKSDPQVANEIAKNTNTPTVTIDKFQTTMSQLNEKDNNVKLKIPHSYDRISFERDLFEEYTNIHGNGRQRQIIRPNSVPKISRPRARPKQSERRISTMRPERPERVRVNRLEPVLRKRLEKPERVYLQRSERRERIKMERPNQTNRIYSQRPEIPRIPQVQRSRKPEPVHIPKKHSEKQLRSDNLNSRFKTGQRLEVLTQYNHRKYHQNLKQNPSTLDRELNNMMSKARDYTPENKARTSVPWWWQYTAKVNKIQEQPTPRPTSEVKLNDAMKNNIDNTQQNNHLEKGNKAPKDDTISGEVPLQGNADHFNVNSGKNVHTGLLEAERQDGEHTKAKKNSMTGK